MFASERSDCPDVLIEISYRRRKEDYLNVNVDSISGIPKMRFKLVKIRKFYRLHRSLKRQFFESRRNPSNYLKKLKLPIVR